VEACRNSITLQFLGANELTGIELVKRLGLSSWSVQLLPPTLRNSADSFLK
jgi:hypothetical protein